MSFAAPYLLISLVLVPLTAIALRRLETRRRSRAAVWANVALLPNMIVGGRPGRARYVPFTLFLLGLTLLLVGFARPQRSVGSTRGNPPTVVVTVDVSGSMAAHDVPPSRIAAARAIAVRLLGALPARDRVALVTFGDKARLVVPPTLDRQSVIAKLPTHVTPLAGTAIGDGIKEAVSVIVQGAGTATALDKPGAVFVLSDGAQTAGGSTLEEAALSAHVDGIPVDAVAVGTGAGTVTQTTKSALGSATSQIAVPVDSEALAEVTQQTAGTFYKSTTPERLKSVAAALGTSSTRSRSARELSGLAGALAALFLVSAIGLSAAWFGRIA